MLTPAERWRYARQSSWRYAQQSSGSGAVGVDRNVLRTFRDDEQDRANAEEK
uniref:GG16318 n=1 Tax=Drosophila erecta TaxID=7220 RepID=B3P3A7_DROER